MEEKEQLCLIEYVEFYQILLVKEHILEYHIYKYIYVDNVYKCK